jgi:hypothetical protein
MTSINLAIAVDHQVRLARVKRIARIMDFAIQIPGTRTRFGADSIIGFITGVGDLITLGA